MGRAPHPRRVPASWNGAGAFVVQLGSRARTHSMHCPEIGRSDTQVGRPRQRMIFVQMAGLLAMPTLLPEGVLSAEGEDAQAVNSS